MKKQFVLAVMILIISFEITGQTIRMGNPWVGRTDSEKDFGRDNQQFLRDADVSYNLMDYEATYFSLDNAVAQNPQSADALLRRAKFKKQFGLKTEAAQDVRLASRLNPYAADLYGYNGPYSSLNVLSFQPNKSVLGLSLEKRLGYYYAEIDKKYGNQTISTEDLTLLEDIIMEIESGNLEDAKSMAETFVNNNPNTAIGYDLQGVIFMRQNNLELAKLAFEKSVNIEPNFAIAWHNLGKVSSELGQQAQAKLYFDKAIDLQQDLTKAYFNRAILLKSMGEKEAALEDYDKIIELRGEGYLEAYLNRGLTKKMLGDFSGALSDLNIAIEAYPNNPELYKNRGNVYFIYGYYHQALEDYTTAISFDENFAEAYFNRGLTHFLLYDNVSGCFDLEKSENLGYERAAEKQKYFCVE